MPRLCAPKGLDLGHPSKEVAGGTFVVRLERALKFSIPYGGLGFTIENFTAVSEDA